MRGLSTNSYSYLEKAGTRSPSIFSSVRAMFHATVQPVEHSVETKTARYRHIPTHAGQDFLRTSTTPAMKAHMNRQRVRDGAASRWNFWILSCKSTPRVLRRMMSGFEAIAYRPSPHLHMLRPPSCEERGESARRYRREFWNISESGVLFGL